MGFARRPWFVIILFSLLIFATRWPLAPGQLFTFDDVNLAYSVGHFDIRMSQPHPPGYPLFVMEMRMLSWLRFRRAESILLTLALLGSLAALLLVYYAGNRILGADSGFWAAWILVLHPVFWHAGVTSALRVQLAVVSLAVGTCCWNAWRAPDVPGGVRWVTWSALAIGIGAGIRPETGPLLFPLWAVCALRAPLSWRTARQGARRDGGNSTGMAIARDAGIGRTGQFHPRQPGLRLRPGVGQFRPVRRFRQPVAHFGHAVIGMDLLRRAGVDFYPPCWRGAAKAVGASAGSGRRSCHCGLCRLCSSPSWCMWKTRGIRWRWCPWYRWPAVIW